MSQNDVSPVGASVTCTAKAVTPKAKPQDDLSALDELGLIAPIPPAQPYDYVQNCQVKQVLQADLKTEHKAPELSPWGWLAFASFGVTMWEIGMEATREDATMNDKINAYNIAGVAGTIFTVSFAFQQGFDARTEHINNKEDWNKTYKMHADMDATYKAYPSKVTGGALPLPPLPAD